MNITQLYTDYNIPFITEGVNCAPGWINVHCCWCDDPSEHLGYDLDTDHYNCWRCGGHAVIPTIARLLNVTQAEARSIIQSYGQITISRAQTPKVRIRAKAFHLPSGVVPLLERHKQYLRNRKFDPNLLERVWNLQSTGPISKLDELDYRNRIIIPFYWNGEMVTFDSRCTNNRDRQRYKACPAGRELMAHKSILYGKQECWKDTGIIVEGPTDVWRLGVNSAATSGIEYTPAQVWVITQFFKRAFVVFDNEPLAQEQAKKLVADLKYRGVDAYRTTVEDDPGSMLQEEANHFVKQLIK